MKKEIPTPLYNEQYEATDRHYYQTKEIDGERSYSAWAMAQVLKRVSDGMEHASLGANVPDRDKKGREIFNSYKKLVEFDHKSHVLEFGCGSLRIGSFFIEYLEPGCFFGMDVEPGLIELGKTLLPNGLLDKRPILTDTSKSALDLAETFKADFIYSNSVVFHIHQDDLEEFCSSLVKVTSKPGAVLIFDARLSETPQRYAARDWAWPLKLYEELLAPLKLAHIHSAQAYKQVDGCTAAHLEFRNVERT